MLKLIKLELKKVKMGGYILGALIANLTITAIIFSLNMGFKDALPLSMNYIFSMTDQLVKDVFLVFASVLVSRLIIDEYKNNTISLLFMYPINRKKLIWTKLSVIILFTFISIVVSNILINAVLCVISNIFNFFPVKITASLITHNLLLVGIDALAFSTLALLPFFFGMLKKSVPTAIVSAILIAAFIGNDNGGKIQSLVTIIPVIIAIVSIFISYLSIRNIEHTDLVR